MKALVILSAAAGKGSNDGVREAIVREFNSAHVEFEIHETVKGDKTEDIVRSRLAEGFDLVVAVGGDGTVSGAFDGVHGSSVPLAIVPAGTGNIIAREFKIPTDADGAVALITGAHRLKKIDAMRIGKRVYVLSAGVGINAAVVARTTRKNKRRFGRLAYVVATLGLVRFRPRNLEITIDGKTQRHHAVEVAVSNCGTVARAIYPSGPDIRPDDGHVDIWILGMKNVAGYVRYLTGMLFGRRPHAEFFTAQNRVTIKSHRPLWVQADGDLVGTTPVEVEILPQALTVLVPDGTG